MAKFGTMEFSVAFQPTSAFPLDARSYFDSYATAEAAALTAKEAGSTDSIYYIGEPIVVVENGKAQQYIIQPDLTLSAIGGSVDTSALEARIDEIAALVGERANADAGTEATGVFKDLADLALETDTKIDNAIAEKFAEITDNGKIDTVVELIKYVEDHGGETEQIVSDIDALKTLVGDVSVQEQIAAILTERNILGKGDNDKLYETVDYEVISSPSGTLVNYGDREIRIMCPADTVYSKQQSGTNSNENLYYIGFRAYAPANAVGFKEELGDTIVDQTMYSFENNEFAGVDALGRKYSVVWLPVAAYDEESATWKYYGKDSSNARYIGWYYSVEWYDADGKKITSDCIRVNLSNEDCHNNPNPYYMGSIIKELAINDVLCGVVNGRVNIESDELAIDENGKLAILSVAPEKVTGLSDLMASGQRLITKDEIDKLAGLILNEDGSVESSGQINMSGVIGLEEALDEKIDGIMLGGIAAEIVDKVAQIPTATNEKLGLVKSAAVDAETGAVAQNGVVVAEDGTMSVASLNVDRLVQDESSYLILNGGSAQ